MKRSASQLMPRYCDGDYERWFVDLMDKCYFLEYKQNLIAEAMEIHRTQYFAKNYPVEFFKYKLNNLKKS